MIATQQITLTHAELCALQRLSQETGRKEEDILHTAVASFLSQHNQATRADALRQARGLWSRRADLPDPATLRGEWQR